MNTIPKIPTLVNSPAETSWCSDCDVNGVHFEASDAGRYFPHCPQCGSTDLVDQRSPYEVLYAAAELARNAPDSTTQMSRNDDLFRLAIAVKAFHEAQGEHCSDCAGWLRRCIVSHLL